MQTFVANNGINNKSPRKSPVKLNGQLTLKSDQQLLPLVDATSTVNSELNSLMCNEKSDQKISANKKSNDNLNLNENDNDDLIKRESPEVNQTIISTVTKPTNGFSNYNIDTLLAKTAELKRKSDNDSNNQQAVLNGQQLNYPNLLNNDLIKQMEQIKNGNTIGTNNPYHDYLYNYYYSIYLNNLNALNRHFNH